MKLSLGWSVTGSSITPLHLKQAVLYLLTHSETMPITKHMNGLPWIAKVGQTPSKPSPVFPSFPSKSVLMCFL